MNNKVYDYKNKDINTLGKIIVNVFLNEENADKMAGVKINLYRINGISPQLEGSKITDSNGSVIFDDLSDGNYRIIEIIDKEVYEKPIYKSWNEVNISNYNKKAIVNVINRKAKEKK